MEYKKQIGSKRKTDVTPAPKSAYERYAVMQVMGEKPFENSIELRRVCVIVDTEKNIIYSKFGVFKNMSFRVFIENISTCTEYSLKYRELKPNTCLYKCVLKRYGVNV